MNFCLFPFTESCFLTLGLAKLWISSNIFVASYENCGIVDTLETDWFASTWKSCSTLKNHKMLTTAGSNLDFWFKFSILFEISVTSLANFSVSTDKLSICFESRPPWTATVGLSSGIEIPDASEWRSLSLKINKFKNDKHEQELQKFCFP